MSAQPALRISGLKRSFRGKRAVDGVDLRVERGEIMGFLGPNGAGKTTLMNMVMGLVRPDHGEIELLGVRGGARHQSVRLRVGYLQERPHIYPRMSARKYLEFFARLYGVPAAAGRVATVLERLGLAAVATQALGTYSRGMQQRVCLARAMLHEPEFLLLDEPTLGLDPSGIAEIREVLREMRAGGTTLFFSSHQLSEMEKICDRVTFMKDGQVVASGRLAELGPAISPTNTLQVELYEPVATVLEKIRSVAAVAAVRQTGCHSAEVTLKAQLSLDVRETRAALARDLAGLGMTVLAVSAATPTLEDLFLALAEQDVAKPGRG